MKFLGKWMKLENIIQSDVTQTQKNTHGMHSVINGYNPKAYNAYDTIYRPYGAWKEGRSWGECFNPALRGEQEDCGRWKM